MLDIMLEVSQWYSIGIACVAMVLVLKCLYPFLRWVYQFARFLLLRYMVYPLILPQGRTVASITRLQLLLFMIFLAGNGVSMALHVKGAREQSNRAAMMASINLIPLFCGGRTSILVDRLGIPLHSYYLAHHWIGRVVVVQGLLHAGLALSNATASDRAHSLPSGILVGTYPSVVVLANCLSQLAVTLASTILLSLPPVRRISYEVFLKVHLLLSFAIPAALMWHLLPVNVHRIIYPLIAISLWSLNLVLRLAQLLYYNLRKRSPYQQIKITQCYSSQDNSGNSHRTVGALKLEVELTRPMVIRPGQYLYLSTNDLQLRYRFQSHPFVVIWWNEEEGPIAKARALTFLIELRDGITAKLARQTLLNHLTLDGPYGQDHSLQRYDTVVLTAKGVGIAAILGYAKRLIWWASDPAQRRRVVTRKLDIYWELENNDQEKWVGEYLKELQVKNEAVSSLLFFT